ncbi:MAG TPA: glycoside hydrolase family 3 N-terminal domain-containing protein, partial [Herpetosiphonaceae bacterium]|nr:glycoside hydrolase family 3 N-terminal domain-containing protein [Herpetosiphonaceae bacterium]
VFELLSELRFDLAKAGRLLRDGIGHITRVAGASSLDPRDGAALANTIQRFLIENTRLGIPALIHEESCCGYMARDATCFPQMIGLASTWQPELAEAMAAVVRTQMRAGGAHQGLAPVLDVTRDPRWGRVEETLGEDPYLAARLGGAIVRGLQGDSLRDGVVATGKHFVGYGMPAGGMNWAPAAIPERELREVFLFPFEAAIKEFGLRSVMNGYHELDGVPCGASRWLLDTILRQEWGFDGVVVADYFAIEELERTHRIAADLGGAAALALEAGIDIELPNTRGYGEPLRAAVESGRISAALIDRSVGRLLAMKFALGLFENPYVDAEAAPSVFDTPEQRGLARDIARQSIVLLKNEAGLLPLERPLGSIALIGPNADSARALVGDYAYVCHIESLVEMRDEDNVFGMPIPDKLDLTTSFVPTATIREVLAERLPGTDIRYAPGCAVCDTDRSGFAAAVAAAAGADLAVVVLGEKSGLTDSCTCGEARDRADLGLPGVQQELLEAIHATGTPIVLVLVGGRPLALPWAAEHVPAILHAWLPGEEGAAAVVETLLGAANPGGKLPISVPRTAGQVPTHYNHKPSGGRSHWKGPYVDVSNAPLWPFGHGLSYTRFAFSNLRLERAAVPTDGLIELRVDVRNVGERAGDEVVQLYARDPQASVTRPVKELKGFRRVRLDAGEQATIAFSLSPAQLGFYDLDRNYVVEPGEIQLMVGASSAEIAVSATVSLTGPRLVNPPKVFFSTVTVE